MSRMRDKYNKVELDKITYTVIGCAMKVHNTLGNGFQEVIYQRCLAIELKKTELDFGREIEQNIFYDDREVGTRRADFARRGNLQRKGSHRIRE